MSIEISEYIKEIGEKQAKAVDNTIAREIANITVRRLDIQRFLKERLILQVTRPQLTLKSTSNDGILYELNQKYRMVYNSPTFWTRLKFYIFDLSLWFKEILRR